MRKLYTLISVVFGYLIKTIIVGIAVILILPNPTPQTIIAVIALLGIGHSIYNNLKNKQNNE